MISSNSAASQSTLGSSNTTQGSSTLSSGRPLPSSSGSSESSLSSNSDSSLSSSSSSGCSISFIILGPLEDQRGIIGNKDCLIQVYLTGCDPNEASITFSAVPAAQNPQNLLGHTNWEIEVSEPLSLVYKAAPVWYGSAPNNICHGYIAPFDVSVVATCPHGTCSYGPVRAQVTLPDASESQAVVSLNEGAGPNGEVLKITDPIPVPGISDHYKCFLQIYGWARVPSVKITDHVSQYRGLIREEENYHVRQFLGQVPFEQGGCGDLWTRDGIRWWLGAPGTSPLPYFGNTPEEAVQAAATAGMQAATHEDFVSGQLFAQRHCLIELRAKEFVGFKEAWTLPCAYPPCASAHFPPYPARHPAYV